MAATERARCRAAALVAAALALASPARAADHATAAVTYYGDSDKVRVVSPSVAGSADVGPVTAGVRASVDVVSAASVDLVSAGSPRGFTEERVAVDASAAYDLGAGRKLEALFGISREPDFFTWSAGGGATWDVAKRQATLALHYAFSRSAIGRTDDTAFARSREQHQVEVGFSPLLSRTAVADLVYGITVLDGYQSNPYRHVRLYAPGAAGFATAVPESAPELRVRHALVLRLRKRLGRSLFGLGEYLAYADTWGVLAHSLRARAMLEAGPVTLTAESRFYRQTAAVFYRKRYDTFPSAPDLRTAEKELGPMWTALGGLHAEWGARVGRLDALRIGLGGDVLHMRYLDYAFLTSRTAGILSFDTTVEF